MQAEEAVRTVTITVERGARTSVGMERRTMTLEQLAQRLRTHEVRAKDEAEVIIPGRLTECPSPCRQHGMARSVDCGGGKVHRLAANVETIEALFLDFDNWDQNGLTEAIAQVEASGYRFICYSSPSYAPPEKAKVRFVFPLAEPYRVKDLRAWRDYVWPALVAAIGLPDADPACSDVARLYYLPSKPTEGAPTFVLEGGERLLSVPEAMPIRLVSPAPMLPASSAELILGLRAAVDMPADREIVERVARGASFGEEGERHRAILRATWLLARLNPRPTSESVEALLAPACAATGDDRDFLTEAVRAYETACDKQEEDSPDAVAFRELLEEQKGTDQAFAKRFARLCGDQARHVLGVGWHLWNGTRWETQGNEPPFSLAAALGATYEEDHQALKARIAELDAQLAEAPATPGAHEWRRSLVEKRNRLAAKEEKFHAKVVTPTQNTSSSAAFLRAAATLLREEAVDFDADPWALNCSNGIVDLRTGALRPHDPEALCSRLAPTEFEPGAEAPYFEQVLHDALPDPAVRAFFGRVVGYALTGDMRDHYLFLLLGSGGNGKSTLLNAITATLGDYAGTAPKSLLMSNKFSATQPYELADLRGKRMVTVMELNERESMDSSRLKSVVGGDRITAARKYENQVTFTTQAKILMPCNSRPRISDDDTGAWRRIALIEFPSAFLGDAADRTLPERLAAEREGILAWAVRGCLEWQRIGLAVPEVCRAAVERYREEENDVAQFVSECVERGEGRVRAGLLHEQYCTWAKASNQYAMSRQKFAKRMEALGFTRERQNDGRFWRGVSAVRV